MVPNHNIRCCHHPCQTAQRRRGESATIKISRMSCTVRKVASVGDPRMPALRYGSRSRTTSRMPTGFKMSRSFREFGGIFGWVYTLMRSDP
jgi:hypothetical protein